MATIITVHGTFASGPEQGSKWWQKGSSFESHVRELVEAHDGELHWQSSIWSGSNSEAARRTAGSALMDKMEGLEARGEPYCVIGHSHGGSVVSAALIEAAHRKAALPHMKLWLTVGTPFITARKNRFLFSRLGAFGQAAYSGIILGAVVGATAAGVEFLGEAMELLVGGTTFLMMVALQFSATIIVPLALAYICVRYAEKDRLALFDPAATKFAVQSFARRWLPLWHRNDEAVQGLKALRPLDVKIFSPDFAIPAMRVAIIGMMLLALLVVLLSPETMKAIYRFEQGNARLFDGGFSSNVLGTDRKLSGDGRHLGINAMLICTVLGKILYLTISPIMPALNAILGKTHDLLQSIVKASFLMIPAWLFAIATMWLVETAARTLSRLASRLLNPVAVNQLRATGFGSDTLTDTATDSSEFPQWLDQGHPPLPSALANELEATSNAAASLAIPKFRSAIKQLSLAEGDTVKSDMLSQYLTWDELIHTGYFNSPRFCKLIAYAISTCPGFRATSAFLQDPDYALVADWHKEIAFAGSAP